MDLYSRWTRGLDAQSVTTETPCIIYRL